MKLHKWEDIKRSNGDPVRAERVRERVAQESPESPKPPVAIAVLTRAELQALVEDAILAVLESHVPRSSEPEPLLDRRGLAAFLDCSVDTVDRLRKEGVPRLRLGDSERFERGAVVEWLKSRKGSNGEP